MSEQPDYHQVPHTLDANREIPEDAPLSAGNTPEEADRVKEADDTYSEAVEEEAPEVGPRDAGDHAGDDDSDAGSGSDDDVPDGTVSEVLDWVGDDSERAQRALDVERTGQNRQTLVSQLETKV